MIASAAATHLLSSLLAVQVPAPPTASELQWDAPHGCPGRAHLSSAIERRLGRALAPGELALAGQVALHPDSPRFRLQLQLRIAGRTQTRTLTAERCSSLVDATSLVVAWAVTHASELPPELPPEPPLSDEPISPPPPPAPVDTTSPPSPDPLTPSQPLTSAPIQPRPPIGPGVLLRLDVGPEYGAVPGLSAAPALHAGLLWRRLRLELGARFVTPRQTDHDGTRARLYALAAALQTCARPGRGALEVPLCGGLELGGLRADVSGPNAASRTAPWLTLHASAGLVWRVHPRVGLSLALQGHVHLTRPSFARIDASANQQVFAPQPASVRLLAGVEIKIRDPW